MRTMREGEAIWKGAAKPENNEEERMKEKRGGRSLFFPAFFVDKGMKKKKEEKAEHKISDKSVHTHVRTIKISIYGQPWDLKF